MTTRNLRVVGTPFPKGRSGNPAGRPKGLARKTRELIGNDGAELVEFLLVVMRNETEKTNDRLEAAKMLAERGWGKPAAFVLGDEEDPLGIRDDEIEQLAAEFDNTLARLASAGAARGDDPGGGDQS